MKEVNRKEFFNLINKKNVTTSVVGDFPYTVIFKDRDNSMDEVGKIVDEIDLVKNRSVKYFLKK
ncbi:hypothetical protein [Tenacibaculum phage Larrie]|nr:hypothetical protein [Tenacibaculum phage Larrie]